MSDEVGVFAHVRASRTRAAGDRVGAEVVRAQRRGTLLLVVGLAALLLSGAEAASAFISANTIDEHATYRRDGRLLRVTGPVRCTRGERVAIGVAVRQPATAARARSRWRGRCTGKVQHWRVTARARRGTRFEDGSARVCAVAKTRTGSRATDRRRWCERVTVVALRIPGRGKPVTAADVCFTVNDLGDPLPSTVRGTLFQTKKERRSRSTALLLQHGAVSERSAWSGGAPVVEGTHDTARSLAKGGYAVFAIDRLGYGESRYKRPPGSGSLLTPDGYIEMTHQLVTHLRAGSYTDCAGKAAGRGAARVVLSGFSSGAAIVEGYATRYHDIDGIIPMAWSNQPELSAAFQSLVLDVLVPQLAAGKDYLEFLLDGADGYSESCERLFFYPPGMRDDALKQLCGRDYYAETAFPTPSGEAGIPALQANTVATIGNVGPTPALLVFSDRDALFPGPDHHGTDPDVVTPEIAMWRNRCNCEASVYIQPNAGHVGVFHKTSKQVTDRIQDWLHDHDLTGEGGRDDH
jgi:alpha-beta hydrolase superfamily lysophospholipase